MRQIKELAEMLRGGEAVGSESDMPEKPEERGATTEEAPFINPVLIMQLVSAFSRSDDNCNLILALRPHLSADKQLKADRAVKLLRIFNAYTALRDSGMLDSIDKLL